MYRIPRVEDFGKVERQVHSITSPPNGDDLEPIQPAATGGGDGGAFGAVLGIAAGIAAVVSARSNQTVEPAVNIEEEEEKNEFN